MSFTKREYQDVLTFGRTTHDTVLDSDGKLKTILNRLNPSTDLTDTDAWTHQGLDSVVASGTGAKGKTRYLLTEDTSTGGHRINDAVAVTAGTYYKHSVDVKSNGRDLTIYLSAGAYGAVIQWNADLTAGTISQVVGGTKDAGFITPLGDDEYRIDLYAEATSTSSGNGVYISLADGSDLSYTGDGSSGVYLSRVRVMKASVHAPVERVTNGTFDTDTDWTKGTGWTIGSGVAAHSQSAGGGALTQELAWEIGATYRIAATIDTSSDATISNSSIGVRNNAETTNLATLNLDPSVSKEYVFFFTATETNSKIWIYSADEITSVDNISVTKVITDGIQLGSDGEDFVDGAGPIYVDGRAYDGNGASLGKQCFEGRTNLVENSNSNWLSMGGGTLEENAAAGIDGDLTATLYAPPAATGVYGISTDTHTSTTGLLSCIIKENGQNTVSLWHDDGVSGRAVFNLTTGAITEVSGLDDYGSVDLGDGWWLCWIYSSTKTATQVRVYAGNGSAATYNGTDGFYVYGAVHNDAASPVPYIPTNGSAVARGADSTYKLLNEFGFRQDQYSVLAEFQSAGSDGADYPFVFSISDGTSDNTSHVQFLTTNAIYANVKDASVAQVGSTVASSYTPDATMKIASAFKQNDFGFSDDGTAVTADTSGSMPPVSTLYLGKQWTGQHLNGYLKRLVVWPTRLADATLVEQSS